MKRLLLGVCLPTAVLALAAGTMAMRELFRERERTRIALAARIAELADDFGEIVAGVAGRAERERSAAECLNGASPLWHPTRAGFRRPVGALAWNPGEGFFWSLGAGGGPLPAPAGFDRWNDWNHCGKRSRRRGWMKRSANDGSPPQLVWHRVDGDLWALAFDGDPASEDAAGWPWLAAAVLSVAAAVGVGSGACRFYLEAERARREELVKTSFVSNVSHELKTPLAAMRIWSELLLSGRLADADRRRHAVEVIASENSRMMRMVENLLEFARLGRGTRRFRTEPLALGELAADVLAAADGELRKAGMTAAVKGEATALADADAVRQILANLVANAVKYAADGRRLDIAVAAAGGRCRLSVADRGPGMPAAARERAFERFWREHDELSSRTGGLGLGLAISRQLALAMRGELSVAARPGGGCEFVLELPAAESGRELRT